VGMQLNVGSSPLIVTSLGRMVASGNTGPHVVKIVDAASGVDVTGGSASIATAGKPAAAFAYSLLPSPVILNANTSYFILSQETQGGDQWYDNDTVTQTTADGVLVGSVYGTSSPYTPLAGSAGHMYVPVDFKYSVLVGVTAAPATAN